MNKNQLRELIRETLKEADLYSEAAEELLMLTAAAESNMGHYIKQTRGPALGIFQMEPATHDDIMFRWRALPKNVRIADKLSQWQKFFGSETSAKRMMYDLKYAIIMCRLKYLMIPAALPDAKDIPALAAYYKKWYNTHLGKATVDGTIEKYRRYVA